MEISQRTDEMILTSGFHPSFFGTLLTISVHHMRRAWFRGNLCIGTPWLSRVWHPTATPYVIFYCLFVQSDKKRPDVSKFEGSNMTPWNHVAGVSQWRGSQARTKDAVTLSIHGSGTYIKQTRSFIWFPVLPFHVCFPNSAPFWVTGKPMHSIPWLSRTWHPTAAQQTIFDAKI